MNKRSSSRLFEYDLNILELIPQQNSSQDPLSHFRVVEQP